jgi:hypothetical protein
MSHPFRAAARVGGRPDQIAARGPGRDRQTPEHRRKRRWHVVFVSVCSACGLESVLGKFTQIDRAKGGKLESLNEKDSVFLTYCNWKPSAAQSLDSGNRIPAPGNNHSSTWV